MSAQAQRKYRASEKGKQALKRYKKSEAFKRIRANYLIRWRARNSEKNLAHAIVKRALKTGILKKGLCEKCQSNVTVAHHDDYSQPLTVRWLCPKHHNEMHCIPASQKGR